MRTMLAGAALAMLTFLGACTPAEEARAREKTREAGQKLERDLKQAGHEVETGLEKAKHEIRDSTADSKRK